MAVPNAMINPEREHMITHPKAEKVKTKSKKTNLTDQKPANLAPPEDASSTKKRKREPLPDEIEIDVSLPEPPSKKALRRAKKGKTDSELAAKPAEPDESSSEKKATAAKANEDEEKTSKRSDHGVWIGNLPFSATRASLREFLEEHTDSITNDQITRMHMPAPTKPANPRQTVKPQNKGFAYVDFASANAMYAAIALSEILMDGRRLLIKNAKSFEGRPKKEEAAPTTDDGRPPNKRIFVGNLGFDVTREDLVEHFSQCGQVADTFLASFEDTGKCKGFAWVTFNDVEAATAAVKGYIYKEDKADGDESEVSDEEEKAAIKKTKRKWFVNRLMGRDLRCEYAEDASVRYKKRYGKDRPEGDRPHEKPAIEEVSNFAKIFPERIHQYNLRKANQRRGKIDARTIAPGKAHTSAPRASQAIVEGMGKKTTFD